MNSVMFLSKWNHSAWTIWRPRVAVLSLIAASILLDGCASSRTKADMPLDRETVEAKGRYRRVEERWRTRRHNWRTYDTMLDGLPLSIPSPEEPDTRHGRHLYSVIVDIDELSITVDDIVQAMKSENIGTGIHYRPLHMQLYYAQKYDLSPDQFPQAQYIGARTLSLPLNADLTDDDIADVCNALRRILEYYGSGGS